MNVFEDLLLDEPPLGIDPDVVLSRGRARLRRRRLAVAVGAALTLGVGGIAVAVPALPGRGNGPQVGTAPTPQTTDTVEKGVTPSGSAIKGTGPRLTEKNLRNVVEQALGHRLDRAGVSRDTSGKEDLILTGSYRGKTVTVSAGALTPGRVLSCRTDLGYSPGVPCRIERLPSGAVMRIAQLASPGDQLDNLVDLQRPDGLSISVGCQNVSSENQDPAQGQPPLTLEELRRAAVALDGAYAGRPR